MKHVFVRQAKPGEASKFLEWSIITPNNEFDPEVVKFPTTFVLCAYNKDKIIGYIPVQQPFFIEAFAANPDATDMEQAVALKELTQAIVTQAHIKGSGEIYFLGANEDTNEFATNQLFEEVPYKLYRIKVKELEPDENNNKN